MDNLLPQLRKRYVGKTFMSLHGTFKIDTISFLSKIDTYVFDCERTRPNPYASVMWKYMSEIEKYYGISTKQMRWLV
jgi:hypothetical protein